MHYVLPSQLVPVCGRGRVHFHGVRIVIHLLNRQLADYQLQRTGSCFCLVEKRNQSAAGSSHIPIARRRTCLTSLFRSAMVHLAPTTNVMKTIACLSVFVFFCTSQSLPLVETSNAFALETCPIDDKVVPLSVDVYTLFPALVKLLPGSRTRTLFRGGLEGVVLSSDTGHRRFFRVRSSSRTVNSPLRSLTATLCAFQASMCSVQKVITKSCKISWPGLSCLSHHRGVSEKRINKFVEGDNFQAAHVQMHLCMCPASAGIDVATIDHESMSVKNTMRWRPLGPCSSTVLSPSSVRLHVHSDLGWTACSGSIAPVP